MNRASKTSTLVKGVLLVIIVSVSFVNTAEAQKRKRGSKKNPQKEAMKKQDQREKDTERAEEKGKKRHLKLQERAVRKRMKQSRKQARRYDQGKRAPFFKRLFRRKKIRR